MKEELRQILKSKIIFIIILVILILISLFAIFSLILSNSFSIKGDKVVNIDYNTEYKDKGVNNKYNLKVKVYSDVNPEKVGKYKVKYVVNFLFLNFYKIRYVNVVDKKAPIIELNGNEEVKICPSAEYVDEGAKSFDEYDGDLTKSIKKINSEDGIIYEVSDASGNKTQILRKIIKEDSEAPLINLNGYETLYVKVGTKYYDSGYEVSDNCDSNVEVTSDSNVNAAIPGNYYYKYIARDSSGNEAIVKRNIVVYNESGEGVIYLTFDDGPSCTGSTNKILNVLREEGVRATFFVTNNGCTDLIRDEYNEGHAIALHTSTHDYSYIYSSVENYFNDLSSIENKVYDLIGIRPKIIRFPGGSNNTVSNRYYYDIMDILTQEVVNRGYNYFDWNVSAGDAGGCTTSTCVYNSVVNGLSKSKRNIVLMHDIKMFTANALSDIIHYAKNQGYRFEVIDENTYPVRFKW